MLATRTRLRTVPGVNHQHGYTAKFGLVLDLQAKIVEAPAVVKTTLLLGEFSQALSDAFQVLHHNALALFFGRGYDLFGNRMVDQVLRASFLSREPFQNALGVLGAFGLERGANPLSFQFIRVKLLGSKALSRGERQDVGNAHVGPDKLTDRLLLGRRKINGLKQVELTFDVSQIGLTLQVGKVLRAVAGKRDFLATFPRPDRSDLLGGVVGKDAAVVGNTTQGAKPAQGFAIPLVGVGYLADAAHDHLTAQIKGALHRIVDFLMELELGKNAFLPRPFGYGITGNIGLLHGLQKQIGLLGAGQQFEF